MDEWVILTRTSPGCGGATSTSSKDNGSLAAYATAAAYSFTNHQTSITMLQDGQSGCLEFYQLEIRELQRERDRERESSIWYLCTWSLGPQLMFHQLWLCVAHHLLKCCWLPFGKFLQLKQKQQAALRLETDGLLSKYESAALSSPLQCISNICCHLANIFDSSIQLEPHSHRFKDTKPVGLQEERRAREEEAYRSSQENTWRIP